MSFSMGHAFTGDAGTRKPSRHVPVLLHEAIQFLELKPGHVVVDGTIGAAGHGHPILGHIGPDGILIGLDRDPMMLELAEWNLAAKKNVFLEHASYLELQTVLQRLPEPAQRVIPTVDRILLDLGLSSDQLADEERGFSFNSQGPLDLRYDRSRGQPTWAFMETLDESELVNILQEFGEERFSRQIARKIISRRKTQPIRTAADLVDTVRSAISARPQRQGGKQPSTKTFQAFRIAVNQELEHLQSALSGCLYNALSSGGRVVVISFHSLEDRIVKRAFRDEKWQNLTPKPITARVAERRMNPRSRSAKLRAAVKK